MKITVDIGSGLFTDCPVWYQNLTNTYQNIHNDYSTYSKYLSKKCGSKVQFTINISSNSDLNYNVYCRTVEGDESEITMMILRWS